MDTAPNCTNGPEAVRQVNKPVESAGIAEKFRASGNRILAVIPARYASTRFPGKPLVDIAGKPMLQHVWERTRSVREIARVVIATDDARIEAAAGGFGAEVRMTSPDHPSGTDRAWEVASSLPEADWILNVQGDEPFIDPAHLEQAIAAIATHPQADIITLVTPLSGPDVAEDFRNPNVVKAALAETGQALYFSRAPIPYDRDQATDPAPATAADQAGAIETASPHQAFRHIGLYLYRRAALERFTQLPPSNLEQIERLEQLRALEAGMHIAAVIVDRAPLGIDTPKDLARCGILSQ